MIKNKESKPNQEDITRKRLIWLIIILSIMAVSLLAIFMIRKPGAINGVVIYEQQTRGHNDAVIYEPSDHPPVGGPHHSEWQSCGIYDEPIDSAKAVHSLEHGAVWITYRPDLDGEEISELQNLVQGKDFMLLSPYPEQSSPIVLTAWGVQLEVQNSSDARIPAFIARYRLGPTTPERGASC